MRRFFALGLTAAVFLSVLAYYVFFRESKAFPVEIVTQNDGIVQGSAVQKKAPEGTREYLNIPYKFSLLIPEGASVDEFAGEQGAATIVFNDPAQERGFQIFIVPYIDEQVSEERFRQDIPSGVRRNMRDIEINGAIGAVFESEHELLGETIEVWFIHDGYLYEVNTLKSLEGWMAEILLTWKFISK